MVKKSLILLHKKSLSPKRKQAFPLKRYDLDRRCFFGSPAVPALYKDPWLCAPWLPKVYLFGNYTLSFKRATPPTTGILNFY
jgi:hypothetical protein